MPASLTFTSNASDIASNGEDLNSMEGALAEARLQLEKEDDELEKAVSGIAVQTVEFEDKIVQFEEFDLQMERELQKLGFLTLGRSSGSHILLLLLLRLALHLRLLNRLALELRFIRSGFHSIQHPLTDFFGINLKNFDPIIVSGRSSPSGQKRFLLDLESLTLKTLKKIRFLISFDLCNSQKISS
ncbi:unnamed protein product [Fraxinus pennsylvanica]|uniref:Uncharacterized protein n=1 Tax=Fraxinus pennsylvanica TaxID=56036 RepID=A0AAD1ZTC5_9LAMI|nr:unnamed protein product [Fraxinus pennsylvanica]